LTAIDIVQDYIYKYLFPPNIDWSPLYFKKRSYERFAANEIIRLLRENPNKQPVCVIESFIGDMRRCYQASNQREIEETFSIAIEVGLDILLLFV
jgi:hypothetical protein